MNEAQTNTPGTFPTVNTTAYLNYCYNRLPCGICKETQTMCPYVKFDISFKQEQVTCEVKT